MATPFLNYDSYATPHGINVKPGGRVVAYVRSTGLQEGDDLFAASGNLYSSINAACNVCKAGRGDIIVVLPGHTETHSVTGSIWGNLKAGTQIVGAFTAGGTSSPTVTLAHTGASLAVSVADVTIQGLKIVSTTAAVTGAVVVTGAGATFERNFITLTGALGANPAIAVTGAAGLVFANNRVIANCTDPIVEITDVATQNLLIERNFFRQAQGTSGGAGITVADAAITGWISYNGFGTATNGTPASLGIVVGTAALPGVHCFQNFCTDAEGGSALITPANNDGN